jgi:diguanylate cyclase (GGDEF)-like protein/PAS domain S-box-containing protein
MVSNVNASRCYRILSTIHIAILALTVLFCSHLWAENLANTHANRSPLTPITLQLKWRHQFQFAGYYAAIAQGYYKEAGFNVKLKEASAQINPIDEVLSGRSDFGIANSELMLYHLNGEPVIAIAAIIQHSPVVLMSIKASNILSPQDLIGKKLMYPIGDYGANTLGILLKEGIQKSQIESIPLSYDIEDLITHKVDAMVGYVTDQPFLLQARGLEYNLIDPRTYGIDFYGDVLFTHQKLVEDSPEKVERFKAATLKGWRYAIEHADEMIDLILREYPTLKTKQALVYEAQETIKLIVPKLVDLGHMNPGRWASIAETFINLKMTQGVYIESAFLYTLEREKASQTLKIFFQIGGGIAICLLIFIACLFYFNKQLKLAIIQKTMYLTKANRELIGYTKQLKEKESELFSLNKNLELHVISRTETISKVNHELTAEVAQRKQRELSLLLLSKAIESSRSIVLIIDKQHSICYASTAFLKLTGLSESDTHNQAIQALENRLTLPEIPTADCARNAKGVVESELECIGFDEQAHWLNTSISLLWSEIQEISHYVITFEDITEHKARQEKMEQIALYDSLTGLENRVLFKRQIEKVISNVQRTQTKTALLFIDIDDFKSINDNFGHETGDHVLRSVAKRLQSHVRKNDSVARVSGDEFIILLNDLQAYDDASKVTQQIIDSFKQPIVGKGREIFVTVSIGISMTPDDSIKDSELINNADLAMYRAKQSGRNNFQFYCVDMNVEVRQKSLIEAGLKAAIQNETFYLVYLPVIDLKHGNIVGAEALIRWPFSEEEVRSSNDFITIAEETGSILPLGEWVMQQTFNDIQTFLTAQIKSIKISVNISSRQLKDTHFIPNLRKLFLSHPNYIQYFEFEIIENCFLNNQVDNIRCLNELRNMGFSIALDDFGTDCAALSYLQRIPVSTIKVDRSLINDLPNHKEHNKFIKATIAMAHELDIKVVAEGVETAAQTKFLALIGCDRAQGFHFGSPVRIEELIARLSGGKVLPLHKNQHSSL